MPETRPPQPLPTRTPSPAETTAEAALAAIRLEVERGTRFLLTSHARPDGDAIGSELALAFALRHLGKSVRVVNHDPPPEPLLAFPGVADIERADRVEGEFDAAFVLECGDVTRPGLAGLERYRLINIDHHPGNGFYGAINWFDPEFAACGEMVMDVIDALGVPLSLEIATHIYVAILTDTGSFRHSAISARTFEICRRTAEAGIDPAAIARQVYDTGTLGKIRLTGALLAGMRLEAGGRLAVLHLDEAMMQATGATYDDTDGLINLPLGARQVEAVAMFKTVDGPGEIRVSLRSKGPVDVRSVAGQFGGGGHRNAAGCTLQGVPLDEARARIVALVTAAIDARG